MADAKSILKHRPIVAALSLAVVAIAGFILGGAFSNSSFPDYIYNQNLLFIGGGLLLSVPIFIKATGSTLRSDLLDREIIEENKSRFTDFSAYADQPLIQSIYRLYLEAGDQRSYATKNLAIGMGATFVSFVLIVSLIVTSRSTEISELSIEHFLYTFVLPRVSGILVIQLIGTLFLRWYAQNVRKISELSDKILYLEILIAAQTFAGDDKKSKQLVLTEQMLKFSISDLPGNTQSLERLDKAVIRKIAQNTSVNLSNGSTS